MVQQMVMTTLGWEGDNLPTVKNQSVVGIVSTDFWLGSLSLNPRPINFTDYNDPIPSLMQKLRNKTPVSARLEPRPGGALFLTQPYNLPPKRGEA